MKQFINKIFLYHFVNMVLMTLQVGVLASGRGSNLQAIIDASESKQIDARVAVVISNVEDAYALERARKHGIPAYFITHKGKTREAHEGEIIECLKKHGVELVVLAGYLRMLTPFFVRAFKNRIINIHPALLPLFGGPGMHGENVHKKVIETGCKVSGCTVHIVDEGIDTGPIILQKAVEVLDDDTPDTLAARILVEEHKLLPKAIQLFAQDRIEIIGRRVRIKQ